MSRESRGSEETTMTLGWPYNILNIDRANRPSSRFHFGCIVAYTLAYQLARRRISMLVLAALVVLSPRLMAWMLQPTNLSMTGKTAIELITPAILCSVLLKLLWDKNEEGKTERAESRATIQALLKAAEVERERHDKEREEREREMRELIRQSSAALDRVAERVTTNTTALTEVRDVIKVCQRYGD